MTIDENTRLDLRSKFAELMGDRLAHAAMEAMPPLNYSEFATKTDLAHTETGIRSDFAQLRGEFAELRGEFAELKGDVAELRGDMFRLHGEGQVALANTMRTLILTHVASTIAVAGFVAGLS